MGAERRVATSEPPPGWQQIVDGMAKHGCPVAMRMIDGELAFPDEQPPDTWRELRVASGGAMITIRRGSGEVVLVSWGTADAMQQRLGDALAAVFAEARG